VKGAGRRKARRDVRRKAKSGPAKSEIKKN
jgi:hypothetical protein